MSYHTQPTRRGTFRYPGRDAPAKRHGRSCRSRIVQIAGGDMDATGRRVRFGVKLVTSDPLDPATQCLECVQQLPSCGSGAGTGFFQRLSRDRTGDTALTMVDLEQHLIVIPSSRLRFRFHHHFSTSAITFVLR